MIWILILVIAIVIGIILFFVLARPRVVAREIQTTDLPDEIIEEPLSTYEAVCVEGELELIGVQDTPDGYNVVSAGCRQSNGDLTYVGQTETVDRFYTLSDECPDGYRRMLSTDGVTGYLNGNVMRRLSPGIRYICIPDERCQAHSDCPDGTICSGGECVPVDDF